jgi:hypothetical protein
MNCLEELTIREDAQNDSLLPFKELSLLKRLFDTSLSSLTLTDVTVSQMLW